MNMLQMAVVAPHWLTVAQAERQNELGVPWPISGDATACRWRGVTPPAGN